MPIAIYNTKTRKKEVFEPINPPEVLWYNCGPTVYDYFHVGNARNFVVADTIRRYLAFRGYRVRFIQNFTDIDDKIIKRAQKEGISARAVARKYTEIYYQQADLLNIQRADFHPKATESIPEIISIIEKLIANGNAYSLEGDVYFRIKSFPAYGSLSGKNIDELMEGARVEVNDKKESPLDFALWKAAKPGEPSWESPWGAGRPGWHIECSAMSTTRLGESIDIHSGGNDLVFPHHENEIAQSECATHKPFVRYWIHNGFLNINNQKMSKSLGNFFTINDIMKKYDPLTIRFFLISAHYRHPLDFCEANLLEAKNAVARIKSAIDTTEQILDKCENFAMPPKDVIEKITKLKGDFVDSMDDDFNTAQAISVMFAIVSELNSARAVIYKNPEDASNAPLFTALSFYLALLKELLGILGLEGFARQAPVASSGADTTVGEGLLENLMKLLITLREDARKEKLFSVADKIRNSLAQMNIILEDHPQGTIWKQKE